MNFVIPADREELLQGGDEASGIFFVREPIDPSVMGADEVADAAARGCLPYTHTHTHTSHSHSHSRSHSYRSVRGVWRGPRQGRGSPHHHDQPGL
jgi:hypothetical protein